MDCKFDHNEIVALLEGKLEPSEAEKVTNHISNCSGCQKFYTLYNFTDSYYKPELIVDNDLHLKIINKLDKERYTKNAGLFKIASFYFSYKYVFLSIFITAAAALILTAGYNNIAAFDKIKENIIAAFDNSSPNEPNSNNSLQNNVTAIDENTKNYIDLFYGYWVSEEFLDVLRETKSPMTAFNSKLPYIAFEKALDNFSFSPYKYQYKIGDSTMPISKVVKLSGDDHYGALNSFDSGNTEILYEFIVDNPSNIQKIYNYDENRALAKSKKGFLRLGLVSFRDFLNKEVLVGKYVDPNNNLYEFNSNSTAVWPDKSFSYGIAFDRNISNDYDLFYDYSNNCYYSFEVKESKLFIYQTMKKKIDTSTPRGHIYPSPRDIDPGIMIPPRNLVDNPHNDSTSISPHKYTPNMEPIEREDKPFLILTKIE